MVGVALMITELPEQKLFSDVVILTVGVKTCALVLLAKRKKESKKIRLIFFIIKF